MGTDQAINVLLPMWVKALAGIMSIVMTTGIIGASRWAWSTHTEMTKISTEMSSFRAEVRVQLDSANAIQAARLDALKDRMDRERVESARRRSADN